MMGWKKKFGRIWCHGLLLNGRFVKMSGQAGLAVTGGSVNDFAAFLTTWRSWLDPFGIVSIDDVSRVGNGIEDEIWRTLGRSPFKRHRQPRRLSGATVKVELVCGHLLPTSTPDGSSLFFASRLRPARLQSTLSGFRRAIERESRF